MDNLMHHDILKTLNVGKTHRPHAVKSLSMYPYSFLY